MSLLLALGGWIALFVAVVLIADSVRRVRVARAVADGADPIESIDHGPTVTVEGTIRPAGDPVSAPLAGASHAAVTAWAVEAWSEYGKHASWQRFATGVETTPFYLDDGTGQALVDLGTHRREQGIRPTRQDLFSAAVEGVETPGLLCEVRSLREQASVEAGESTPHGVTAFTREHAVSAQRNSITNLLDIGNAHGDRRYYETAIEPGETVCVRGYARPVDDEEASVKVGPPADDRHILSELTAERLHSRASGATYTLAIGVGLVVVAVLALRFAG